MDAGRILLPPEADFPPQADPLLAEKKQGQSSSDAGAPREASDSCLCERGKPADGPESLPPFSNEIRAAINHAPS